MKKYQSKNPIPWRTHFTLWVLQHYPKYVLKKDQNEKRVVIINIFPSQKNSNAFSNYGRVFASADISSTKIFSHPCFFNSWSWWSNPNILFIIYCLTKPAFIAWSYYQWFHTSIKIKDKPYYRKTRVKTDSYWLLHNWGCLILKFSRPRVYPLLY